MAAALVPEVEDMEPELAGALVVVAEDPLEVEATAAAVLEESLDEAVDDAAPAEVQVSDAGTLTPLAAHS